MTKLAEALRAHKIYNSFGLLERFGETGRDVVCRYMPREPRMVQPNKTVVSSPSHKTAPGGPWYDYDNKSFTGNRAESMSAAIAWASDRYRITEWAACPFGGAMLPKYVVDAAKAFVKEQQKAA